MDCKVYKDIEINQIQNTRHDIYIYILEGEVYYYLDLMGDIKYRHFRNDIVDQQNFTLSMIFKTFDEIDDYRKFWNYIQENMCQFQEGKENACFIISDSGEVAIATTKKYYPEFTYFESIETAQEILEATGPERIKLYMF